MRLRTIPYGYEIVNGKPRIKEEEANIVRYIFSKYINGSSLKEIADDLTNQRITYFYDKNSWNKNMISRILENEKYIGKEQYPCIVSSDIFESANLRKTKMGGIVSEVPQMVEFIKGFMVCGQCGGHMGRQIMKNKHEKWLCVNNCKISSKLDDEKVFSNLLNIFNQTIRNPELLKTQGRGVNYSPTTDLVRQAKEIDMAIEQTDVEFGVISKMILDYTSRKYECCQLDKSREMTDILIDKFRGLSELKELDITLIRETIQKIYVCATGFLSVRYINDAEVK